MPQVIIKVPMDKFYYALNHAARRRPEISTSCTRAEDLCIRTSGEFHRRNPQTLAVTLSTKPGDHKRKLADYYSKVCHVRLAMEGNDPRGGFIVLDGELLGLHSIDKGKGDWMMREAVSLGADRLDCFDIPHLINLYQRHGFKEILREPNNKAGGPDIVWMRRN